MKRILLGFLFALAAAAISGALSGFVYAYFLPAYFPGYGTIWIGILGISAATVIGGYIGYEVPKNNKLLVKLCVCSVFAASAAYLAIVVGWFIVASIRGE